MRTLDQRMPKWHVHQLLKKYKLDEVKHATTPMALNLKRDLDRSNKSVLEKVYRGIIGSLFYLIASRPYIIFSVRSCARF